MSDPARAILLLNLGGPETLGEVKPFLFRLFSDPEIIRVRSAWLRKAIAWFIATTRASKSKALYAQIGGGSPIRRLTDLQAGGLEGLLRSRGKDTLVRTAFTCSAPLVEDVVRDLYARGVRRFLAFPLYPQYSLTTTKGALDRSREAVRRLAPGAVLDEIRSWPDHPLFVAAHARMIEAERDRFSKESDWPVHLLFSAHSIPEKLVTTMGDPYPAEVERSCAAIVREAGWKESWSLAWQSRLGPVKWLEPSTHDAISKLGAERVRPLVVPVAFVTDHIETLHEIDIDFRRDAERAGIPEFRRTPGLNNHPLFLECLTAIAEAKTEFWS